MISNVRGRLRQTRKRKRRCDGIARSAGSFAKVSSNLRDGVSVEFDRVGAPSSLVRCFDVLRTVVKEHDLRSVKSGSFFNVSIDALIRFATSDKVTRKLI